MKGRFNIKLNSTWQVKGKDGNVKPVFQPNKLFLNLIKRGILSPNAMKIPLLGNWSDKMVISNLITNAGFAGVASRVNGADAEAAFKEFVPVIDGMVNKGIVPKNKAARHKSRLNAHIKAL